MEYQQESVTLIRLLPQLKASDAHLLDDNQRACLYRALNRDNPTLARVILQALEQVGDSKGVPYVQKVAEGYGRSGQNLNLRAWAQQCLPFLLERAEEERARQILLRPSSASEEPSMASDTLRRPAAGAPPTASAQLLRAAADAEEAVREEPPITASILNNPAIRSTDEAASTQSVCHL